MDEEKVLLNAVICFLAKGNQILLGFKTKKIGKGCWNGYGGGIESGESPREAAVRELEEETGGVKTSPENLEKIALVDFHNTKSDGETFICRVHIYLVRKWTGEVKETEEMVRPTWFEIDQLPLEQMMPSDRYWLLPALSGRKVVAKAYLSPFQEKLLKETEIKLVDSLLEK